MDNKSQQNDEVELLQSILFESMEILDSEPYHKLDIHIKPDCLENPIINCLFHVEFNENYPSDELFTYKLEDVKNKVSPSQFNKLHSEIKEFFEENKGSPIVFQIVEMIKEYINELELQKNETANNSINSKSTTTTTTSKIDDPSKLLEKNLVVNKNFTPVSKEAYDEWFKKFYQEKVKEGGKALKLRKEILSRTSGREFFMNLKAKNLTENNEEDIEGEEDIDYDELNKLKQEEIKNKKKGIGKDKVKEEDVKEDEDEDDEDYDPNVFDDDELDYDEIDFDDEEC